VHQGFAYLALIATQISIGDWVAVATEVLIATIGLTVMQACAHRCVMQSEVFCHLVLVASADIVPEHTRGHTASVKLRNTT